MTDDTVWIERYRGLTFLEAVDLAEAEGRPVRILGPGALVTLDWRPDRLNLHVDGEEKLLRVGAG